MDSVVLVAMGNEFLLVKHLKKNMNKLLYPAFAALLGLSFTAPVAVAQDAEQPSIVEIALGNPAFTTLVAAVVKTDLVDTLDGSRQFTVFAPTNDAFDAAAATVLGEGSSGPDLVEALDVEALTKILLYHVSPGKRVSGDVLASSRIRTVSGGFIRVDGSTLVGDGSSANLVTDLIDIDARNGVIHVIDFVLLP